VGLLRASLATLAALSIHGGLSALMRYVPSRSAHGGRLEKLALLLHHAIALSVAVAALLVALLRGSDGRPLLLCIAGPLLVLALQDTVSPRVVLLSVPLAALGLACEAAALLRVPAEPLGIACAVFGAGACAAGAAACFVRSRRAHIPRAKALLSAQGVALAVAALAGVVGALPLDGGMNAGIWAIGLGAAGSLGTAARLKPSAPPGLREVIAGAMVLSLGMAVGAVAPLQIGQTLFASTWAALVSVAVFSLVRATVEPARLLAQLPGARTLDDALPSAQALAAMTPILDDALLRRPSRPRVIARVPARRLLDAALDKARSAQPQKDARIEVVSSDLDVDVDGDPADLAEALCAVLDNALRVRAQNPGTNVQVLLRGNAAAVTFEVTDQARDSSEGASSDSPHVDDANVPSVDAPFLNPRADLDRPGLGVSLARARILVERNGGKLLTRSTADGSTVQLTMPRRMLKGAIGQA
jgi:hypothetical protein